MTPLLAQLLIALVNGQRPSYAGTRPIGRPELANRFQTAESTTVDVANRIGDSSTTTQRIPVDALGDHDLVDRLNDWPRENRPFWLLNAYHIEQQRNKQAMNNVQSSTNLAERGGFEDDDDDIIMARPSPPRSPFLPPLDH